ncbi:DUF6328 family protein [Agromyces mangrovi Wang et al. 2018]|uniref:DUF6328 family protein n=1 Tax=Agromyces mangrovi TaxID=1858653 RepID=UPI002573A6C3|nr:DUF6328 family protein [Agromyces mangrovi]BDZ64421.1 hypothetical protein GCM10025877_13590 [Agromyces mangrovi]
MTAADHARDGEHDERGPRASDADSRDAERDETRTERLDRNWGDILQEVRVSLTGTQLIGGFLLAVAFQQRFTEMDAAQLALYLVLVALSGLATVLGLGVVAVHRAYFGKRVKDHVVRIGNRYLVAHLVVVALLVLGVTTLLFDWTLGRVAGAVALVAGAIGLALFWLVLPRLGMRRGEAGGRHGEVLAQADEVGRRA